MTTLCGVGAARLLLGGGSPIDLSGDLSAHSSGSLAATATASAGSGGIPPGPRITSPAGSGGGTATPRSTALASPGASPTPGATSSPGASPMVTQPTPTPGPALTFAPTTITLTHQDPNCSGSQTINNTSQGTVGWQWVSQGMLPPSFMYSVNSSPATKGWPQDWSAGIPAGGNDQLQVQSHMPDCNKLPAQVTVQDSQGATYAISLKLAGE